MPCYYPIHGWKAKAVNPSGKRSVVFVQKDGYYDLPVKLPCGRCIGCRLDYSRQWATRCVHEASLHEENSFLTLTYNDNNLPSSGSLNVVDIQKFFKRLRKAIAPLKVRFFQCGEYGELLQRPHHHVCLFGYDFPDKVLYKVQNNIRLYSSQMLEDIWTHGLCTVGQLTFESAAYVARYCTKKVNGAPAKEHYSGRRPEYVTMSRRPGIAHDWIQKFHSEVYYDDSLIVRRGVRCKPPKYYDSVYDLIDRKKMSLTRGLRERKSQYCLDNKSHRLIVREQVKKAQVNQLQRSYENGR